MARSPHSPSQEPASPRGQNRLRPTDDPGTWRSEPRQREAPRQARPRYQPARRRELSTWLLVRRCVWPSSVSSQQHSDTRCPEALQRRSLDPAESPRPRAPANVQAEQESAHSRRDESGRRPTRTCCGGGRSTAKTKGTKAAGWGWGGAESWQESNSST